MKASKAYPNFTFISLPNPTIQNNQSDTMNVAGISTEDLLNELHQRQHQFSPDEFLSPAQSDYKAKLDVLRGAIIRANVAAVHRGEPSEALQALASKCDELDSIYGNPLPARAYAVNTTFYGKDALQDHAPKPSA